MIGAHVENIVNAQTAAQRRLCRTVCVCVCACVCGRAPKPSAPTIGDVQPAMREIEGGSGAASREECQRRGGLPLSPPCERAAAWAAGRRRCVCQGCRDGEPRRHRLRADAASR